MGKGPIFGINRSFGSPENRFSIYFSKEGTRFCFSLHYNGENSYLFVNRKSIFQFKADNGNPNFATLFFLGSISDGFHANESSKLFLEENVFDFSVDYNAIDKSDTLDIHKYLMVKNNAK